MYENFYFHVGLHKTATTYLQETVFPHWPDISYRPNRNLELFLRMPRHEKQLISCEQLSGATFAPLHERCRGNRRLADMFPGANTIVAFRSHGDFLASLYSQYLRYGGQVPFRRFFRLGASPEEVVWHQDDIRYRTLIETIETAFNKPPFVFQMKELWTNRESLFSDLAEFMATSRPTRTGGGKRRNVSLGAWQGSLLREINKWTHTQCSVDGGNRPYRRLARFRLDPPRVCQKILGGLPSKSLVSAQERKELDEAYSDDWHFVENYIQSLSCRH